MALVLFENRLTGPLPAAWGCLENLEELDLANNHLTGPLLPVEWSHLDNLGRLYLSDNSLMGPLPPEWGRLSELAQLECSQNELTGLLPSGMGQSEQPRVAGPQEQ